jgi:hypothetical protein
MLTSDRPPRMNPTKIDAKAIRRLAMPPSAMMAPAKTKNGIANSENLLTPLDIWIITASSGNPIHRAPITETTPSV